MYFWFFYPFSKHLVAPHVKVRPHIKWERPGQDVSMECRAQGEPLPTVRWLKNDNLVIPSKNKYTITGDGITLKVDNINFSDTAAYTCEAQNEAGKRIDISSLVVIDEQALPPGKNFVHNTDDDDGTLLWWKCIGIIENGHRRVVFLFFYFLQGRLYKGHSKN